MLEPDQIVNQHSTTWVVYLLHLRDTGQFCTSTNRLYYSSIVVVVFSLAGRHNIDKNEFLGFSLQVFDIMSTSVLHLLRRNDLAT